MSGSAGWKPALPHPSMATRGDGLSRAMEEAVAEAGRPLVCIGHFGDLEKFLAQFAEMDFHGLLLFPASDAETQHVTRFLLCGPAFGAPWNVRVIPTKDLVANLQSAFGRGTS